MRTYARLTLACLALMASYSCGGDTAPGSTPTALDLSHALDEISALPTPANADPIRFTQLKEALANSLRNSGQTKFMSVVPAGPSGAVDDLALAVQGGGTVRLEWTYRNKGDYDQNKQVTISDLSVLGASLGKTTLSPDWISQSSVADGDSNGEINISDITPLGANLFATVSGYKVQRTVTPGEASSWIDLTDIPFDSSTLPSDSALRVFNHSLVAIHGAWYRVVAYDGTSLGSGSNEVQYSLAAPEVTAVTPSSGVAGTAVTFMPTITGGTLQSVNWDFGGGAVPNSASVTQPTVTLAGGGTYNVSITASNAAGTSTFDFTLTLTNPEPPVILDVQPRSGEEYTEPVFTATLAGGPVATYAWDFGGGAKPNLSSEISPQASLRPPGIHQASLTVTNAAGSDKFNFPLTVTWYEQPPIALLTATPESGEPGEPVALDASMSYDPDGSIVKYEWRFDGIWVEGGVLANTTLPPLPPGENSVGLRVTDNEGLRSSSVSVGLRTSTPVSPLVVTYEPADEVSFAVVAGHPAIVWAETHNDYIRYCRATTADGSAWGDVVSAASYGQSPNLVVINGHPAISYRDINDESLMFVRASDQNGTSWNSPQQVAAPCEPYTALLEADGHPAVAWVAGFNGMKYLRATDPDGANWGGEVVIDSLYCVGGNGLEMKQIGGKPALAYFRTGAPQTLMYARALDAEGSSWAPPVIVPGALYTSNGPSLAEVNGNPAVSAFDFETFAHVFIRASNAEGTLWDPPVSFTSYSSGQSICIAWGVPVMSYGRGVTYRIAEDPNGTVWDGARPIGVGGRNPELALVLDAPAMAFLSGPLDGAIMYTKLY